jgi:hypothetical protein
VGSQKFVLHLQLPELLERQRPELLLEQDLQPGH